MALLSSSSPMSSTENLSSRKIQRDFAYVPYGMSAVDAGIIVADDIKSGRATISCDGRIPGGVTLELTHWTGNETPDFVYADTSTGMALKLAAHQLQPQHRGSGNDFLDSKLLQKLDKALVLNNHYDTDGVLSVWTCLEPELALQFDDLLVQGAEAGDFGEWSSDLGVKLNEIVEGMCNVDNEATSYTNVLDQVPVILKDLQETGGQAYKDLWEDAVAESQQQFSDYLEGKLKLWRPTSGSQNNRIVIVEETTECRLNSYALDRALRDSNLWKGTTRILRATKSAPDETIAYSYQYHKIGHGWVQKLVDRHMVPNVNGETLATGLMTTLNLDSNSVWKSGGSGLTAICETASPSTVVPDEVAAAMLALDEGLSP